MSHWLQAPVLRDASTGEVLLDLSGTTWDLIEVTETATSIRLHLRAYPGIAPAIWLGVSLDPLRFEIDGQGVGADTLRNAGSRIG